MLKNSRQTNNKLATKRGATSLYVVIFTTLLLAIIVLSFIRIILSEAMQTSNSDLSQSAYDSALAGVEDAKIALLKYHQCLSRGSTDDLDAAACANLIQTMQNGINSESCDVVRDVLSRASNVEESREEVLIQETTSSNTGNSSSALLQAYTCVKISEELDDYRSTLGSDQNRVRIVPIRTDTDKISSVKSIKFSWYSDNNSAARNRAFNFMGSSSNTTLKPNNASNRYAPPVIYIQFYQAGETFSLTDFYASGGSDTATNRVGFMLYPYGNSTTGTVLSKQALTHTNDKTPGSEQLFAIPCLNNLSSGAEFACEVSFDLPEALASSGATGARNAGATFMRVSFPYGTPTTDFSVKLYSQPSNTATENNLVKFSGVQASVDSTGRANDLYRRIETRVELMDVYFPYPEFAVQAEGTGNEASIKKNFYITKNCWYATAGTNPTDCSNNGEVN